MTTIAFDSYRIISILTSKGYSKEQAEGILEAVKEVDLSHLATKNDLLKLESSIENKISENKADMYKFIITALGVQTGVIGILLALFKFA